MTTLKSYRMTDLTLAQLEEIRNILEYEQAIKMNATEAIAYAVQRVFWQLHENYEKQD